MFELIYQSDLITNITSLIINSLLPGMGLLLLLMLGSRALRKFNAATQYAVTFSALGVLIAAVLFLPALSFVQFDEKNLPSGEFDSAVVQHTDELADARLIDENAGYPRSLVELPESSEQSQSPEATGVAEPVEIYSATPVGSSESEAADLNRSNDEISDSTDEDDDALAAVNNANEEAASPAPLLNTDAFKLEIPGTWAPVIFALWLIGLLVMLFRVLYSYGYLVNLKRRAEIPPHHELRILRALQANSGIERKVEFLVSDEITVPVVAGLVKPAIILPRHLMRHLAKHELEQVVLHEMAHMQRYDDWGKLAQQILQLPLFFHPATWWIGRTLDFTREVACDDWLIAHRRIGREDYSESLCKVAAWSLAKRTPRGGPPLAGATLGMAASRTQIEKRIKLLLDKQRDIISGVSKSRWATLSLGLIAAAVLMFVSLPDVSITAIELNKQAESGLVGGEVPDVIYKHQKYVAANTFQGSTVALRLVVPPESRDFWQDVVEISFPEAPEVEVASFYFRGLTGRIPETPQRLWLGLNHHTPVAGIYDVTELEAIDEFGNVWQVPLGEIRFDVRHEVNGTGILNGRIGCGALDENPVQYASPGSGQFGFSAEYVFRNYSEDITINIESIEWGDEYFSDLDETRFGIFEKRVLESDAMGDAAIAYSDVQFPRALAPGEEIFIQQTLLDSSQAAIFNSDLFVNWVVDDSSAKRVSSPIQCSSAFSEELPYESFSAESTGEIVDLGNNIATLQFEPMIFKHQGYLPLEVDRNTDIYLNVTPNSFSFFNKLETLSFPEHPEIEVTEFSVFATSPPRGAWQLRIQVNPEVAGAYELTHFEAVDEEGGRWSFQFGSLTLDVRSLTRSAETAESSLSNADVKFPCDTSGQEPLSFGESVVGERRSFEITQTTDRVISINSITWGQERFSNLQSATSWLQLVDGDTSLANNVDIFPVPMGPDDKLIFNYQFEDSPDNSRAAWIIQPVIEYELTYPPSSANEFTAILRCGSNWNWMGFGNHLERFAPELIEAPNAGLNVEELPVIYRQVSYLPMTTGYYNYIQFTSPFGGGEWWQQAASVSFPEAPEIEVLDLNKNQGFNNGRVNFPHYPDLYFSILLNTPVEGSFDITKMHVVDGDGVTWEVELGLVRLDIRDGTTRAQFNAGVRAGIGSSYGPETSLLKMQNYADVPLNLTQIEWDDSIFEGEALHVLETPELPVRLDPGDQVDVRVGLYSENARAIYNAELFVTFEILEGALAGQIVHQPLGGNLWNSFQENYDTFSPVQLGTTTGFSNVRVSGDYTEPAPAMYKHKIFYGMNSGFDNTLSMAVRPSAFVSYGVFPPDLTVQGTSEASFWDTIVDAQFPEAPEIAISAFEPIRSLAIPNDENSTEAIFSSKPFQIDLSISSDEIGIFDVTRLQMTDADGSVWEVQLGQIRFDVRDGTNFAPTAANFTCQADSVSSYSSTFDHFQLVSRSEVNSQSGLRQNLVDFEWGEDFFSNFNFTDGRLLIEIRDAGAPFPIQLPYENLVSADRLHLEVSLQEAIGNDGSIFWSRPLVAYEPQTGELRGQTIYESVLCDVPMALSLPIFGKTGSGSQYVNSQNFRAYEIELISGDAADSASEVRSIAQAQPDGTTIPNVIYKHRVYQPMNVGIERSMTLAIPNEAELWWRSAKEIRFPEAPEIEHIATTSDDGIVVAEPTPRTGALVCTYLCELYLHISIRATETGIFDVTYMEVTSSAGRQYEVPLGQVRIDAREFANLDPDSLIFSNSCDDGSTFFVDVADPSNYPADFALMRASHTQTGQSPVEIVEIEWGEDLFGQFEGASLQITNSVFVAELEHLELPLTLEQSDQIVTSVFFNASENDAVIGGEPFVGYRFVDDTSQNSLIWEPMTCASNSVASGEYAMYAATELGASTDATSSDRDEASTPIPIQRDRDETTFAPR